MKTIAYHIIALIVTGIVVIQTTIAVDIKDLEIRARQGDAEAMYELGKAYEDGVGVLQNYVQAHVWYNLSASRGYTKGPKARDEVARYMTPNQLEEAQELALNWKPEQGSQKKGGKSSLLMELFTATRYGDEKKVKELLDAGGDPNTEIRKGVPLLVVAVNENRLPVVKTLAGAGANVNATMKGDMSILMIAIQKGHDEIAHYLIEKGADVNAKSQSGATP